MLRAIRAPDWHGHSLDALNDSMVWSEINDLAPPYELVIHSLTSPEVIEYVERAREMQAEGRTEHRLRHGYDVQGETISVLSSNRLPPSGGVGEIRA